MYSITSEGKVDENWERGGKECGKLTAIDEQVVGQRVPLVVEHIGESAREPVRHALRVRVELREIVRQANQRVQRADLRAGRRTYASIHQNVCMIVYKHFKYSISICEC